MPVPGTNPCGPHSTNHSVSVPPATQEKKTESAEKPSVFKELTGIQEEPPVIVIEKSVTDPQINVPHGSSGNIPPSCCITLILCVPSNAFEGTEKLYATNGEVGVPTHVPIDSFASKF